MRIVIASLAAALIVGLAVSADAATSKKKHQHAANKAKIPAEGRPRATTNQELGYDSSPEHYQVGTREWWRAMEREGRGGFGNLP